MKRIWNRANPAIYSISSVSKAGFANMNICTWATKVSFTPAIYMVAVEQGSKTHENIFQTNRFLLQLLGQDCLKYVRKLGYKTGHSQNKLKNIPTQSYKEFQYLAEALAFIELEVVSSVEMGDHTQFFCKILKHKSLNAGEEIRLLDFI